MTGSRARWLAPLAVAALVLGVIAAVWAGRGDLGGLGAGDDSGSGGDATPTDSDTPAGDPPPLRLTSWIPPGDGADPRFHLASNADLPGAPGRTAVHEVVPALQPWEDLRVALGPAGDRLTVDPKSGVWNVTGMICAQPPPGSARSDCPSRTPGGPRSPLLVAGPVLDAVGLGDAPDVQDSGDGGVVRVDPRVADLPTTGLTTQIVVGGNEIAWAQGWLVRTVAGPAYPLVDARSAYEDLIRTPRPMPMIACPEPQPPDVDPMRCGGPITVTGARLGLSVQESTKGPMLVPSWLFDVKNSPEPIAQVAVEPRLLRSGGPAAGSGATGGAGGGGGSGSGVTRSVPPASAAPVPPAR